ncbi:hypothetical protein Tco_0288316, partial [Tanacetum coccineum]
PPSSNEPTSPQPLNPLLENILDVPPRPLNPQPLQSLPSLDITLSLSIITPLENLSSPPSPSPPPPQPPITRHPLYYNYHGSTCICCVHNRNLYLNLRDEINIMFAHLEYLLTIFHLHHRPFSNGLIMENPKTFLFKKSFSSYEVNGGGGKCLKHCFPHIT